MGTFSFSPNLKPGLAPSPAPPDSTSRTLLGYELPPRAIAATRELGGSRGSYFAGSWRFDGGVGTGASSQGQGDDYALFSPSNPC
jgi:hypothetical protein